MSSNRTNQYVPFTFNIDPGNGNAQGISSENPSIVTVEPVIATLSNERGFEANGKSKSQPGFSLRTDGRVEVFGLEDTKQHGKKESIRRLNALERYNDPDYFKLIDVLLLKLFAAQRGGEIVKAKGAISVPIKVYKDKLITEEIKSVIANGKTRTIVDHEGCELRINIKPDDLMIIPEGVGSLYANFYDLKTLQARSGDVAGVTMIVDIGYLSTDVPIFDNLKYDRDSADTFLVGMGNVVRAIRRAFPQRKGLEDTAIDAELRSLATIPPGEQKLAVIGGQTEDITEAYDQAIDETSSKISQAIQTRYSDHAIRRALLSGGGTYHLGLEIQEKLTGFGPVSMIDDPENSNVVGGFIMLQKKLKPKGE